MMPNLPKGNKLEDIKIKTQTSQLGKGTCNIF